MFKVALWCVGLAGAFVGVLYALPRSVRKLPRNDKKHVWARISCLTLYVPCAFAATYALFSDAESSGKFVENHGLNVSSTSSLLALTLAPLPVVLLFLGPLVQKATFLSTHLEKSIQFRNYVFGPMVEELIFRAAMLPLLVQAGASPWQVVWLAPLYFGVAHLHHGLEHVSRGASPKRAALMVTAQFAYTTLFGWIASYLFLRTQNVLAPIVAHVFCNIMGLPQVSFIKRREVMVGIAYVAGIFLFFVSAPVCTAPVLYGSTLWT